MSDLGRRLAERTLELVRIPSASGREQALADHVAGVVAGADRVIRHDAALVAMFGMKEPADEFVVLAGHLDTVPEAGHPEPAMDTDRITGLGSSDMKGALAVMLEAGAAHRPGQAPLALVFYDCEEIAYERNGLRPLLEREPWLGRAAAALLMEPTSNRLELGCLGTLHALVTVHGTATHSARPWTGENAIHKAAPFLSKIAALPVRDVQDGPVTYREVVSITLAEGGTTRNVVPDAFTLNLNLRFAPDRSAEQAEAYARSLIPEGATVEITDLAPSAPARMESPWLEKLAALPGVDVAAKQAWTDVSQFADLDVPAANFGPGIPEVAHKTNEYIPVENLVSSYDLVQQWLTRE